MPSMCLNVSHLWLSISHTMEHQRVQTQLVAAFVLVLCSAHLLVVRPRIFEASSTQGGDRDGNLGRVKVRGVVCRVQRQTRVRSQPPVNLAKPSGPRQIKEMVLHC